MRALGHLDRQLHEPGQAQCPRSVSGASPSADSAVPPRSTWVAVRESRSTTDLEAQARLLRQARGCVAILVTTLNVGEPLLTPRQQIKTAVGHQVE